MLFRPFVKSCLKKSTSIAGVSVLLASVLMVSNTVAAAPEKAKASTIELVSGMLSHYEWQLKAEDFSGLPSDAPQALLQIVQDETVSSFMQQRALAALSLYSDSEVWAYVQNRLSDTSGHELRKTLNTVCTQYVAVDHPTVTAKAFAVQVLPLLEAGDANLRPVAAQCLTKVNNLAPDADITLALQRYNSTTQSAWERRAAGLAVQ